MADIVYSTNEPNAGIFFVLFVYCTHNFQPILQYIKSIATQFPVRMDNK